MLGEGVGRDRDRKFTVEQFGDQGDPRTAPDQHEGMQVAMVGAGHAEGPDGGSHRLFDGWANQGLELAAAQAGAMTRAAWDQGADVGGDITGQSLLGFDTISPQGREAASDGRVFGVDAAQTQFVDGVGQHCLVEVQAAEMIHTERRADDLETVVGLLQDGDVEGATAEVIDRDLRADGYALLGGILDGGGHRFRAQRGAGDPSPGEDVAHQLEFEQTPTRRMGDDDMIGRTGEPFLGQLQHPTQKLGLEGARVEGLTAGEHGYGVADAAFELAQHALRFRPGSPFGRLAEQHGVLLGEKQHRGHGEISDAEFQHPWAGILDVGSRGERGAEIDS